MRALPLALLLFLIVSSNVAAQAQPDPYALFIAGSRPKTPAEELKTFHLPPGFQIELVASEPDIIKPINMNFDAQGRLWLTQSIEYPFPAPPTRQGRDTIKIIDRGKTTTYAGGL